MENEIIWSQKVEPGLWTNALRKWLWDCLKGELLCGLPWQIVKSGATKKGVLPDTGSSHVERY